MFEYIEKTEKITLPIMPTRGLVAFPSVPIAFEAQREFSKKALIECEKNNDGFVFLVSQKDFYINDPTDDDFYKNGTVCKVTSMGDIESDRMRVVGEGMCRGEIISLFRKDGCIFADIMTKTVSLSEEAEASPEVDILMREVMISLENQRRILQQEDTDDFLRFVSKIKNPGQYADHIAFHGLVLEENRQKILDVYEPIERLRTLISVLDDEAYYLTLKIDVLKQASDGISNNNREYFLREQLKVIQGELGEFDDDFEEYSSKIDAASLPYEVKSKLLKELNRLAKAPAGGPDANVIRNYLDLVLELPFGKYTKDTVNLDRAEYILQRDHYGLKKPKERILEYLAVKQIKPDLRHQVLCFVGPPGVGKTSLGSSIAEAMGRKFVRVSLGGIKDEAEIRGHRKTYVAAMPGRIIQGINQAGTSNPVMLLDEIDKLCSDMRGDPASALLEVLDGEQNKSFRDHFVELPFDLSDVMFIATANTLDTIPRALLDRMEIIELSTYTKAEKINIARNHLWPKQLSRHGLTKSKVRLSDASIAEIIDGYTRESGVRTLERTLATICRKAAKDIVSGKRTSVSVGKAVISEYLGPRKFIDDSISDENEVGVVNGLAYTSVGGDMLKIEVAAMNGTGKIELTGTLGDVMKESAHIAVSYIRSHASELGIDGDFFKNHDIHIHVPEGATPKDGPSAGVTMLSALVSLLTENPARCDTAMTGEITLTGRVLPIGGLREKATAAWNANIKRVLIPEKNLVDLYELDSEVRSSLEFIPCSKAEDVLKNILVNSLEYSEKDEKNGKRPIHIKAKRTESISVMRK